MASFAAAAPAAAAPAPQIEGAPGLPIETDGLEHLHYPSQDVFKPSWLKQLETDLQEAKKEVVTFRDMFNQKS